MRAYSFYKNQQIAKCVKWPSLLVLLLLATVVSAQSTLKVITKSIDKTLEYKKGYEVNIEGEKAEVVVQTWDKDEVKVNIELIAKHPDLDVAKKDIEKMRYIMDRKGKKIYIRNFVAIIKGGEKPESNLKAKYVIYLPSSCPVNLSNYFGKANVSNLDNQLDIESEFCKLWLSDLSGKVSVDTRFGDVDGVRLDGKVKIKSTRSNITLKELKGVYDIKAKYGVLKIYANRDMVDLNINAEKSDVHFFNPEDEEYNYNLMASYGEISVPQNMKFDLSESMNVKQASLTPSNKHATVTINITFGNINIE